MRNPAKVNFPLMVITYNTGRISQLKIMLFFSRTPKLANKTRQNCLMRYATFYSNLSDDPASFALSVSNEKTSQFWAELFAQEKVPEQFRQQLMIEADLLSPADIRRYEQLDSNRRIKEANARSRRTFLLTGTAVAAGVAGFAATETGFVANEKLDNLSLSETNASLRKEITSLEREITGLRDQLTKALAANHNLTVEKQALVDEVTKIKTDATRQQEADAVATGGYEEQSYELLQLVKAVAGLSPQGAPLRGYLEAIADRIEKEGTPGYAEFGQTLGMNLLGEGPPLSLTPNDLKQRVENFQRSRTGSTQRSTPRTR